MSYDIQETFTTPVLQQLALEVDGEVIARAVQTIGGPGWSIKFGDALYAGVVSEYKAREIFAWLGEKLSTLTVITGPEELHRAPAGSSWSTEYNGGNRYRRNLEGAWEYNCPEDENDEWHGLHGCPIYHGAYPLTAE